MLSFLRSAKSHFLSKTPQKLVSGNLSCDLDSVASAILLSRLLTLQHQQDSLYVPFMPIPEADLVLRPDIIRTLEKIGLEKESLIFQDTLPDWPALVQELILVDHNRPSSVMSKLEALVSRIYDHHVDESFCSSVQQHRYIIPCGSCTSLIALEWKNSVFSKEITEEEAWLGLGAILSDTANMKPSAKKATAVDEEAVAYLLDRISDKGDSLIQIKNDWHHELSKARKSIRLLSDRDLLRRDYKQWTLKGQLGEVELGMSTIGGHLSFEEWCEMRGLKLANDTFPSELLTIFRDWMSENNLDVFGLMTVTRGKNSQVGREFALVVRGKLTPFFSHLVKELESSPMQLQAVAHIPGELTLWHQGNVECSRKQVFPLLKEVLESKISAMSLL